ENRLFIAMMEFSVQTRRDQPSLPPSTCSWLWTSPPEGLEVASTPQRLNGLGDLPRREVPGDLGQVFVVPAQSASLQVIHGPGYPLVLRRRHRAQVLGLQEEQPTRSGLVLEFSIMRRQSCLKLFSAAFERGQRLGRCQSE